MKNHIVRLKDYHPESFEIKEKFIQMNENQIKFNNIKKDCPSIYCLSRLSNHFAKKYISLFN